MSSDEPFDDVNEIAIVGMAGRFPQAGTLAAFWENLRDGVEAVSFFTDQELLASGIAADRISAPNYVKACAILGDIDRFDAAFFGFNPREAEILDPQQRFFLECAWEALEHAGYDPEAYAGRIGVFAGTGLSSYWLNVGSRPDIVERVGSFQVMLGNDKDYLATRTSYKLNLKGPSITVQTACSTSLVAVHLACQSLLNKESDLVLAGGVHISAPEKAGYLYHEGDILSPDGHCRAFDARAQGIVGGNGVGIVVLKRLADARADGDTIHAIVKGSAINNDGSAKLGYTAPSVDAQTEVVAEALAVAGVEPDTIGYIEAHGTGTPLGDPIEIAALTRAFRTRTERRGFCAVGSVKTNIGHLDAAAGVAGLIKTVLALKHRQIPPSLHFTTPNPQIDFSASPFYVNTCLADWKATGAPRRAGVSSLGIGGTNVHVVLEEAPATTASEESRPAHLLVLSAKTRTALETAATNLAAHLRQHPDLSPADVAYTMQVGRQAFSQRLALVYHDTADAAGALETWDAGRIATAECDSWKRPVVFLFPGQGAQYAQMAAGLYRAEPAFRKQLDRCAELLRPHLGLDLREVLYPQEPRTKNQEPRTRQIGTDSDVSVLGSQFSVLELDQTWLAQPALFAIEYALAQLWMRWGVRPQAMIGHSIGEYVAACLAGVFGLEDALALVAARGRLMQNLPGGAMLAIPLPPAQLQPLLEGPLGLAAINGPRLCVVSGPAEQVDALQRKLAGQGIEGRRLHTSHAFHSPVMDSIIEPFAEIVGRIQLKPPKIPFVSNLTGAWISAEQATDPHYWAQHLRQPVRFADGLREILSRPERALLEVGPGQTLSALVREHPALAEGTVVASSLRHPRDPRDDLAVLLGALGQLWLAGVPVRWAGGAAHKRRRIPLPTYPFERRRFWVDPAPTDAPARPRSAGKAGSADWFYRPAWRSAPLPAPKPSLEPAGPACWLILSDSCGVSDALVRQLEQAGQDVITVRAGEQFARHSAHAHTIRPRQPDDYTALLDDLSAQGKFPTTIVHAWSVTPSETPASEPASFEQAQEQGCYSLLLLARALAAQGRADPLQVGVIANQLHRVAGETLLRPEKATLLGPCKVIPQEYPHITCRSIDVMLPMPGSWQAGRLAGQIAAELAAQSPDMVVAYRDADRWVQTFEPVSLDGATTAGTPLREGGVYLITGGLGRIGLLLAGHLAQAVRAKLVLVGRSALPERAAWAQWLATHDQQDTTGLKIQAIQAIEALGAEVLLCRADVSNLDQMRAAVAATLARFGALHGLFHLAGATGEAALRPISETGLDLYDRHFQPKAHGLYVLERVLEPISLDFCMLFSSLSAVLGGLGFTAYAAANLFMDHFAHRHNLTHPDGWISVNWDGWRFEETRTRQGGLGASIAEFVIAPDEGIAAIECLLASGQGAQIVVSTGDLQTRIDQWLKRAAFQGAGQAQPDGTPALHPRPQVQTNYVAPRDDVEQQIAAIWQDLLGIAQVGIDDNFFVLGGHSLLAIQLLSRLRAAFQVDIPLRLVFEMPTIADLSVALVQLRAERADDEVLAQLLAELEDLPEEQLPAVSATGDGKEQAAYE